MNIGLHLHDAPEDRFWERLLFALEHGFSTVYIVPAKVLPGVSDENAARRLDRFLAEQIRCALKLSGLHCAAVGCECDPETAGAEAVYRAHMRLARHIGAKCVCAEGGHTAMLPRLAEWAKAEGVSLAVDADINAPFLPEGVDAMLDVGEGIIDLSRVSGRVCGVRVPAMETIRGGARLASLLRLADSRGLPILLKGISEQNADAVRRWIEARHTGMSA